jgi:ankyrin repeat protein
MVFGKEQKEKLITLIRSGASDEDSLNEFRQIISLEEFDPNDSLVENLISDSWSPLFMCLENDNLLMLKELILHPKLSVSKRISTFSKTALHIAIQNYRNELHVEIVRVLLSHNDIDLGLSALFEFTVLGTTRVVSLTPLELAKRNKISILISLLEEYAVKHKK